MTRLHPIQGYHPSVPERVFLLSLGFVDLFFQPTRQSIWADTIDSLYASHTWSLVIGRNDLLFFCLAISMLRCQHTALITIFTPVLLATTAVVTVLYNILTTAMTTLMGYEGLYHSLSLSLITSFDALCGKHISHRTIQ